MSSYTGGDDDVTGESSDSNLRAASHSGPESSSSLTSSELGTQTPSLTACLLLSPIDVSGSSSVQLIQRSILASPSSHLVDEAVSSLDAAAEQFARACLEDTDLALQSFSAVDSSPASAVVSEESESDHADDEDNADESEKPPVAASSSAAAAASSSTPRRARTFRPKLVEGMRKDKKKAVMREYNIANSRLDRSLKKHPHKTPSAAAQFDRILSEVEVKRKAGKIKRKAHKIGMPRKSHGSKKKKATTTTVSLDRKPSDDESAAPTHTPHLAPPAIEVPEGVLAVVVLSERLHSLSQQPTDQAVPMEICWDAAAATTQTAVGIEAITATTTTTGDLMEEEEEELPSTPSFTTLELDDDQAFESLTPAPFVGDNEAIHHADDEQLAAQGSQLDHFIARVDDDVTFF